jgi:hypothetical protein
MAASNIAKELFKTQIYSYYEINGHLRYLQPSRGIQNQKLRDRRILGLRDSDRGCTIDKPVTWNLFITERNPRGDLYGYSPAEFEC